MAYLYTRPERVADGTVHLLGILTSILATSALLGFVARDLGAANVAAATLYGGAAIFAFVASALYHLTPWDRLRPYLLRIDHAAIFLKIAATYTPFVVLIGSLYSFFVLGVVWALAGLGIVGKLTNLLRPGLMSTLLYLGLGWAALVLIWPLWTTLPTSSSLLMILGGILYSTGVPFLYMQRYRFGVPIWHSFVLAGSAVFFVALLLGLQAQRAAM